MTLLFHACPPAGEWFNDPNGLVKTDEGYTLFVQHRTDAPDFKVTGWGRLTSPDGLSWQWQGPAIKPEADRWIYSGCVVIENGLWRAVHTEHNPKTGLQSQAEHISWNGAEWHRHGQLPIPSATDRRDPFLVNIDGIPHMLLARPCGWDKPELSSLELWRQDHQGWRLSAVIGHWNIAPAILWEVPLFLPRDSQGHGLLIVSQIDRQSGRSTCRILGWPGRMTSAGFTFDGLPQDLDFGLDAYAMMLETPAPNHAVVWAASWQTAREPYWPGFHGGPIGLMRALDWADDRLVQTIPASLKACFDQPLTAPTSACLGTCEVSTAHAFDLAIVKGDWHLLLQFDCLQGLWRFWRFGPGEPQSSPKAYRAIRIDMSRISSHWQLDLLVDGPLLELFIAPEGYVGTFILPGDGPITITIGPAFSWFGLTPSLHSKSI